MKNNVVITASAPVYEEESFGATLVEVFGGAIAMSAVSTFRRLCGTRLRESAVQIEERAIIASPECGFTHFS